MTAAWLAHIAFTIIAYPVAGISVMLPSILLCGLSSWLFGYTIGLITLLLTHPCHMLAMMYNLDSLHGWRAALEPQGITGGIAAQLCAVLFMAVIRNNHRKSLEITAGLETRIRLRSDELKRISEYMMVRSEAEHSRMSEAFCTIVSNQQTGLYYHSEVLMNALIQSDAPQADSAIKLAQLARQNMEQVKSMTRRISSQKIVENGIEQALHDMCSHFSETADTDFTISLSERLEDIPEDTSLNIYRIAHEAVTNALRHGKATHIKLSLNVHDKNCTLEVVNNGKPIPCDPSEGLGMRLIQQRADIINATVRLEPTAAGRTRFECIIPLHASTFHCPGMKY